MQKTFLTACLLAAAAAQAHDVWVGAPAQLPQNSVLNADLAYSHDFPHAEKIAADRVHIFAPLTLVKPDGSREEMVQSGENYQYISNDALDSGSYWVVATYKPTFWVKTANGKWSQNSLQTAPDAVYCEQSQMFAKALVNVGTAADKAAITRPIGQELEIVPLANPNAVQAGGLLPLQVLYKGQPLAGATVTATADTVVAKDLQAAHEHREIQAYSAKTDKEGKLNLLPLVEGLWKVKVINNADFADAKVCAKDNTYATLIVPVGTERVQHDHDHEHEHEHHHH